MYNCRVRRLPAVDTDSRLIGILSRADVLAIFDRTEEGIREDVRPLGLASYDPSSHGG